MADGYQHAGDHKFADLDEWLCEYVDGTIDPVVCKALEEYMQHNEELASHVARLRETRHLLCQYGCSYQAPSGLQPRLRRRLATEIIQESQPFLGGSTTHLMALATLTSFVALFLIFAAAQETSTSASPPAVAESHITTDQIVETAPSRFNLAPYQRATPVISLIQSQHYSRFTVKDDAHYTLSKPRLYPLGAYMEQRSTPIRPQPAQAHLLP